MNYGRPLVLKKSTIGYGCLVLLGSVSVAGAVELELQHKIGSKGGKSIETWFSNRFTKAPPVPKQQSQPVTFSNIAYPFTWVGGQVYPPIQSAWPYVKSIFEHIKSSIKSFEEVGSGFKSFLKSLLEPDIFNNLFKDLHLKIGKVLSFSFAGGEGRSNFIGLFQQGKRETTQTAIKFLLGMEHKGSDYFKSNPKVFNYLLLRGMNDPENVTNKFERLSQTLDKLINNASKYGKGATSPKSPEKKGKDHTYLLEIPTVKQYLDVEEGLPEIFFNMIWAGEVTSKIKMGQDLTNDSKSGVSGFFNSNSPKSK